MYLTGVNCCTYCRYYNSRFDTAYHIRADEYPQGLHPDEKYDYVTLEARLLANVSTVLAQYLYKASTGKLPPDSLIPQLTADPLTVGACADLL